MSKNSTQLSELNNLADKLKCLNEDTLSLKFIQDKLMITDYNHTLTIAYDNVNDYFIITHQNNELFHESDSDECLAIIIDMLNVNRLHLREHAKDKIMKQKDLLANRLNDDYEPEFLSRDLNECQRAIQPYVDLIEIEVITC